MLPLKILSAITAVFAYALVALSPIVRITGSGMGCGDDWPLCNGRLIPPLNNLEVMIEWGHRLAAAGVSVLVVAVAVAAWVLRDRPGTAGPGGLLRPAVLALALLVSQVLLGAVTVWFELPAWVVVLHMSNALALLAAVCVTAFRAFRRSWDLAAPPASLRAFRGATLAAGLGGVALALGALTANMNAGMACEGFPLCSGSVWPLDRSGLAQLHWMHRLVAYTLLLHVIGMTVAFHRRGERAEVLQAVWVALGVLVAHVVVAALMIFQLLPMTLRATHAALGALVWMVLVYLTWLSAPTRDSPARG